MNYFELSKYEIYSQVHRSAHYVYNLHTNKKCNTTIITLHFIILSFIIVWWFSLWTNFNRSNWCIWFSSSQHCFAIILNQNHQHFFLEWPYLFHQLYNDTQALCVCERKKAGDMNEKCAKEASCNDMMVRKKLLAINFLSQKKKASFADAKRLH
jgi:hypothetical protein